MTSATQKHWYFGPLATVFGIVVAVGYILFSKEGVLTYDDGLRHFTHAGRLQIVTGGWSAYLYSGYFSSHPIDPWHGFHWLIAPLMKLGIAHAMKIYVLSVLTAFGLLYTWVGQKLKLSASVTSMSILMLLLTYSMFFARIAIARPLAVSAFLIVLTVLSVLHRKIWLTAILLLLTTLLSHLFLIPLVLVSWGCIWLWIIGERTSGVTLAITSLASVALGISLHPDGIAYLQYVVTTFYQPLLHADIGRGIELETGLHIAGMPCTILGICSLFIAVAVFHKKTTMEYLHHSGISYLWITILLLDVGLLLLARLVDFVWPLSILLLMMSIALFHDAPRLAAKEIFPTSLQKRWIFLCVLFLFPAITLGKVATEFCRSEGYHPKMIEGIMSDIPTGSYVLNLDWDHFPLFMAARPDLLYARGMDPTYDVIEDAEKADVLLVPIRNNRDYVDWHKWVDTLLDSYTGNYLLFSTGHHPELLERIVDHEQLELLKEDEEHKLVLMMITRSS